MANNNVNVNLSFTADTSNAQAQLQNLQTSLKNITNSTNLGGKLGITSQIQEGIKAAAELQVHLQKAVNINTGNLDFSKLSQSLKQSGTSLQQYGTKIQKLGPTGQQAFQQLAQSVAQSEIPLRRTSALLTNLGITLKNTIKWQLSSSLIHGFMGSIQKAFGYAQDLNESLNNIRIVTGKGVDEMAKFAKEANKAAKALSTTTTAYTDASLIFYQQGLNNEEVLKRTDVVVKMANVTKQSVEESSDQMTAIWNNFYDGTKSLEYYADVLTKLGAATASSTDEIAGGLEKFAAIGQTIGLSYEYAASALATITAKTRQSEDVVGTALKTIFGRLEGLKLGESLEDGTSLNKYSEALQTAGVSIFDSNNQLRDMDNILDDLGSKWQSLSRDQQVALAQTVGGMRQYNQLISLMDNWDFMKENLDTAKSATGELSKQHEIYEESWDAASKRVQASLEEMYSKFINDEFFIDLTDALAKFVDMVNGLIDSMGGLDGLLMGIGVLLTRLYSNQIANGIVNMTNSLKLLTKTGQEALATERAAFLENAARQVNPTKKTSGIEYTREQALMHEVELSDTLRKNAATMSDLELEAHKIMLDRQRALDQENIKRQEILETTKQQLLEEKKRREMEIAGLDDEITAETYDNSRKGSYSFLGTLDALGKHRNVINSGIETQALAHHLTSSLDGINPNTEEGKNKILELQQSFKDLQRVAEEAGVNLSNDLDAFIADLEKGVVQGDKFKTIVNDIAKTGKAGNQKAIDSNNDLKREIEERVGTGRTGRDIIKKADESFKRKQEMAKDKYKKDPALKEAEEKAREAGEAAEESFEKTNKQIAEGSKNLKHWSQGIVGVANGAMSLGMVFSSIQGAWNTLKNPDMSGWEKFLSLSTSLGMAIPMLISGLSGLKTTYMGLNSVMLLNEIYQARKLASTKEEILQTTINTLLQKAETDEKKKQAIATTFNISLDEAEVVLKEKNQAATLKNILLKKVENLETSKGIVAKTLNAAATGVEWIAYKLFNTTLSRTNSLMIAGVAIIGVLVLAIWGIVSAFKAIAKNSPEGKLKAAKEESKELSEQLEKTKKAAEELKAGFDKYKEIQKKLEECTKGTQEWNEALRENNDTVLELLEKYPQLKDKAGAITIGADGQLIISEEAMAEVINLQAKQVAINTAADNAGKQNVRQLEIENKEEKLKNLISSSDTGYSVSGSLLDMRVNTFKEKYNSLSFSSKELENLIEQTFPELGKENKKQIKEYIELYNEINQLKEENRTKTQLENLETGQQIASGLEGQENFNNRNVIANILSNQTFDPNQTYSTVGLEDFIKNTREGNNLTEEQMLEAYKEALSDKVNFSFGANGSARAEEAFNTWIKQQYGDNVKYEVIDFEGEQVRFKIDGQEEESLDYGTIARQMLSKQQQLMNEENYQLTADYLSGLTKEQADVFNASEEGKGIFSEELLKKNKKDIDKIIDSLEMTEEQMKAFGITDLKVWKKQQKEIINSQKAFTNLKKTGIKSLEDVHAVMGDKKFATLDKNTQNNIKKQTDEISRQLSESLGADSDLGLDPDFVNENYKIIQDFLNNVDGSGEELQKKLQEDAIVNIKAKFPDNAELREALDNQHRWLTDYMNSNETNFKIGADITSRDFFDKCSQIISTAKMTQEEAEKYFGEMGFDVEGETKTIPKYTHHSVKIPKYNEYGQLLEPSEWGTYEWDDTTSYEVFSLKSITPNASFGGNVDLINNSSNFQTTDDSTGDGGGNKKTGDGSNKKKTKKSDIVERYKPITAKLEKQADILSELDSLQDKLYGTDRLDNIDRYINSLEKENQLLDEKLKLNKQYKQEDFNALQDFAKKEGLILKFDIEGNLENETEIQEMFWKQIKSTEDAGKESDKLKEKADIFKDLAKNYAESLEIASEIIQKQIENYYKQIEKLQEKDDIQLELFDKNIEKSEKKLEKSFGIDYLHGATSVIAEIQKSTDYINNIALPNAYNERTKIIQELEKYGINIDKDTMTATNETEILSQINDDKTKAFIQSLLGGLGMWNQKVDDYFEIKENNVDKTAEIRWEAFDYKVELKGIITDLEIQKIDLKEAFINDKEFGKKIALGLEKYAVNNQDLQNAADKYAELMAIPVARRDAEWYERATEAAQEYSEAIIANQEELLELFEGYKEMYSEIHDYAMEAIDDYAKVADELEHYQNLVDALGNERDYDAIDKIAQTNLKVSENKLKNLINYQDQVLKPQRDQLAADIANGRYTGDALEKAKDELKVLDDLVAETANEINATLEEKVEIANQILENGLNKAVATFEEVITGGFTLEELTQTIETLTKKQEEYLTKTNQLYETNKMIRQAQLEMDKTDNLLAKQKYQGFIKETQQLAAQEKLSQQDLKIAQARYQLLQAQIALEEAQKAKDSMRLVRGADGNWDYVYTANQDKIAEAEGKVADAENSLYNIGLEGAQNYRDKMLEADQEYLEKVKEANETYKNDQEKLQQVLDQLYKDHIEYRTGLETEMHKAIDLLTEQSATGYVDYMLGNIASTEEFAKASEQLYNDCNIVVKEWQENTSDANQKVNSEYNNLNKSLSDLYTQTNNIATEIENTLIPQLTDEAKAVRIAADEWLNLYNNAKLANEARGMDVSNGMSEFQKSLSNNEDNKKETDWSQEMLKAAINDDNQAFKNAFEKRAEKEKETGKNYGYTSAQLYNILTGLERVGFDLNHLIGTPISTWAAFAKEKGVTFASGGYTGEWGPEGKFAMLHQKELVLNAQDTANMLATVDIVRKLSKDLDLRASSYQNALAKFKAETNLLAQRDTLKQDVTIHAEFPNVSSREEIEAAFNNLVNDAVQYVNMG